MGSGGAGYEFEIEPPAEGLDYVPYSVAMANDTQTERQPVLRRPSSTWPAGWTSCYTIFGQVVTGTDVIDADRGGARGRFRRGTPLELVTIESIEISGGSEPLPSGD